MDAREFLLAILEYFIANIPTIIALIVVMFNNFKQIKKKVSNFDTSVLSTEKNIVNKVEEKVSDLLDDVNQKMNKLSISFEDKMRLTIDKVDETLDKMGKQVANFENELVSLKTKNEHLFKTNKVAFDVISLLISGNDKFIDNGVASIVVNKMRLSKEELEKYPNLLATDKEIFANAMKEQYIILGKENFEQFIYDTLMGIGDYGKEK